MSSSTTHATSPSTPYEPGAREVLVLPAEDVVVVDVREGAHDRDRRPVERVTDARGAHSDDVSRRMRTYAISMGVRTACVLAAALSFPHWWAWLFVPGAVVLPYVAVVLANVGGERVPVALPPVLAPTGGPAALPAPPAR